jgi:hypothetical protein
MMMMLDATSDEEHDRVDEGVRMDATVSIPPEIDAQPDDEGQNDSEVDPGAEAPAPLGLTPHLMVERFESRIQRKKRRGQSQ